jgi:D-alanyl-D-alanine carboxypeptidase
MTWPTGAVGHRAASRRTHARVSRRWIGCVVAMVLVASLPAPAVAGWRSTWPGGPYAGLEQRLQDVLANARSNGLPGVSAAIETPDGRWTGVAGKASLRPERAVTPETAFEAGSVTKTFVAAVVLMLVDEGKLSLTSKLSRWMPDFPSAGRITIRHLLSHTSGLRDLFDDPANQRYLERHKGHRFTFPEIVRRMGRPRARPGASYYYSNANYILLGRIVERVTGEGIARVIRSRLLTPLGLGHTWFQGEEAAPVGMSGRRAMGYARRGGGWDAYGDGTGLRPWTSMATFIWAAGAMMSTPTDLARWARALYGGRVPGLSASSLQRMTDFNTRGYGLGARTSFKGDREAWGHGGSLDGFQTGMWYLPAIDASVVLMWNRWPHDTARVTDRLAERLVDRLDPDTTPPEASAPRVAIRSGTQVSMSSVRLAITWPSATEDKGRVVRYDLERSVAGGAWTKVALEEPLRWGVDDRVHPGRTVRYRVRATNDEGMRSAWAVGATLVPEVVDEDELPDAAWQGSWRSVAADGAIGDAIRRSSTTGSLVRYEAEGVRAMAVVMSRASTRGRVAIRWGDADATVLDLGVRPRTLRWVASSIRWGSAGTRAVTLTLRTGAPEMTEVDGFVVLRDAG